ncbi:MAG: DsrE family protein [Anaerolineae bacterium]|nr:DsrE family protein [Anaerolineae bacterium]
MKDKSVVILFKSDGIGVTADQSLRENLARKFLLLLHESDTLPAAICFMTDGVKLCCEGSPLLEPLAMLEEKGVPLVICKTCVDAFGIADKVRVGVIGGMTDIIHALWTADKVIDL